MSKTFHAYNQTKEQNEHDIERYLQIRDEIQDAIKQIDPSVAQLNGVTKQFVAPFDVFQKLSRNANEHIEVYTTCILLYCSNPL
jgi:hypothetical protein